MYDCLKDKGYVYLLTVNDFLGLVDPDTVVHSVIHRKSRVRVGQ